MINEEDLKVGQMVVPLEKPYQVVLVTKELHDHPEFKNFKVVQVQDSCGNLLYLGGIGAYKPSYESIDQMLDRCPPEIRYNRLYNLFYTTFPSIYEKDIK